MSTTDPAAPTFFPIDRDRVLAQLEAAGVAWRHVTVVPTTGSTNADLVALVASGEAFQGAVVAADTQTAGRGRLGRAWASPPGTTLSFSVALTPPSERSALVPALAGVAVAEAIRALGGLEVTLKWPNDVMIDGRKTAGILAEATAQAVIVGCGINVSIPADQLPVDSATSLSLHGPALDRTDLLAACIIQLHELYERWHQAGYSAEGSGLLGDYRSLCGTIGQQVSVAMPDGSCLTGTAEGIDPEGHLIMAGDDGERRTLTAGDVTHVRHA